MICENSDRKYKDDRVINLINSNFISLKDKDMKKYNEILHGILNEVVTTVKEKNAFLKDHYRNIIFVGSYYKGTKVGKPEEFDLDLVIQLPVKYESIQFKGNVPGYTKLKLSKDSYKPGWETHRKILTKWVTPEGYLNQEEFRQYMESSLGNMPKLVTVGDEKYHLNLRKSGPAFTLYIKGSDSSEMSVDLVPVLEFKTQPPIPGDFGAGSWFAVPKTNRDLTESHLYWRMSFYDFEKSMLKKNGSLKPVIRQLKKLRDTAGWNIIASYHIETLLFHRIKAMENKPDMQKNSMTQHFIDMLGRLKDACETNKIINFWDKSHNLIEQVKPAQLASIKGRLEKIIKQIEKDPLAIADYVLTKEERSSIETELNGYRSQSKISKSADPELVEPNETQRIENRSCNMNQSSESSRRFENFLKNIQRTLALTDKEAPISVTAAANPAEKEKENVQIPASATKEKTPISIVVEKINSSSNSVEKNDGFSQIINMLKLIQRDITDAKEALNLLNRRVAAVENKVDILLSRSS